MTCYSGCSTDPLYLLLRRLRHPKGEVGALCLEARSISQREHPVGVVAEGANPRDILIRRIVADHGGLTIHLTRTAVRRELRVGLSPRGDPVEVLSLGQHLGLESDAQVVNRILVPLNVITHFITSVFHFEPVEVLHIVKPSSQTSHLSS